MKIAYLTAGAAGMFCGSCMRDNTLVRALRDAGHDAILIPLYTPTRTDEENVSQKRIFFGGINVFLQQKFGLFRSTPWFLDRLLDRPGLLRWVSRFAVKTEAQQLGDLTVAMLEGANGRLRKEVDKLVTWIETEIKPDLVVLTAALISGVIPELMLRARVAIAVTLQGDDIFLDALPEPHRSRAIELIRRNCQNAFGYLATCRYYADHMSQMLGLSRDKFRVIYPGLDLAGHDGEPRDAPAKPVIGYFARICPEKGLHHLVDAFIALRTGPNAVDCALRVSGWLGGNQRPYLEDLRKRIDAAGLAGDFSHHDCPDHASKIAFLRQCDVVSVPTVYREPKGLYVLEALANGIPVVQPRHGSFPELIDMTGGGLLVEPDNPAALADGLRQLIVNNELRKDLARRGQEAVRKQFNAAKMADESLAAFHHFLGTGYAGGLGPAPRMPKTHAHTS